MRVFIDCGPKPTILYFRDLEFLKLNLYGLLTSFLQTLRNCLLWKEARGRMVFLCLGWVSMNLKYGSQKTLVISPQGPQPFRNTESLSLSIVHRMENSSCLLCSEGVLHVGLDTSLLWGLSSLSASNWWRSSNVQEGLHCKFCQCFSSSFNPPCS